MRIDKDSFDKALKLAMEGVAFEMKQEMQKVAPIDTGHLQKFITYDVKEGEIVFDFVHYAKYVEFGTLPHIIKPKDKKALFWKGASHPVKFVRHPGTQPQPFIRNTFRTKLLGLVKKHLSMQSFEVIV